MKKICIFMLTVTMLFALTGCSSSVTVTYPVTVSDVTINEAPSSVVSLSPAITRAMYDLNLTDSLVGIDSYTAITDLENMAVYGTTADPNITGIIASGAEYVLVSGELDSANTASFEEAGITVIVISTPKSYEDVATFYQDVAMIFAGQDEGIRKAENIVTNFEEKIEYIKTKLEITEESYLYIVSDSGNVATGDTLESSVLDLLGFTNLATEETGWIVDDATLSGYEPDFIILSSSVSEETLLENSWYENYTAVDSSRVIVIDDTLFTYGSFGIFDAILELAENL